MDLFYDPAPQGFESQLAHYEINECKAKEKEFSVKIRVKLNSNSIIELYDAVLSEDYIEEQKVEIPKKKEEQKKQE